jgi:hypothetical protein
MITATRNAVYAAENVARRIKELNAYHVEHPDLPRQDDVLQGYVNAIKAINEALPPYLRVDFVAYFAAETVVG